ncbi:MAG: hypothetical protein DWQ47_16960 [Acidobacteria bacterium]|nr:MAG: hypothetical protein DWQ32_04360 [Acidobacteriota bacterium]REK02266.1 MAG: hypothetical protein DWQ38_07790 [Acidobacteriota bacterium]REK13931.1 MAG: hypothetical protein DWQ43_10050 [Acidobacteriota bacterium]REK41925.1 MAG: hypothetical protein DWQ47_16960 [Acidobacteriota bacterium]
MQQPTPKVLIISSDTGGGHRSAAEALANGFSKFWHGESAAVRVIRAVEDSHHITDKLVRIYNWILINRQHWMKYLYWTVNKLRPETQPFFLNRCIGYLRDQFEKWCPHIVVSVHPLTQHIFARILRELNLKDQVPLVTVVTDPCYGFWKGWACDDVSLYLVANGEAKRQLVDYGVDPAKIKISGMPIRPEFRPADEKDAKAARSAYGLDEDKFTVFVNAGYVGGVKMLKILRELIAGEIDVQAIFLAGKNDELKSKAEEVAKNARFPVKVIGYSEEVERLMQAANVMVSKLGGLTTFEAVACNLPIIADATTPPMPQEAGTVDLVSRRGACVMLNKTSDIVPIVRNLVEDDHKYLEMKTAVANLAMPNSTEMIVNEITALLPPMQVQTKTLGAAARQRV